MAEWLIEARCGICKMHSQKIHSHDSVIMVIGDFKSCVVPLSFKLAISTSSVCLSIN